MRKSLLGIISFIIGAALLIVGIVLVAQAGTGLDRKTHWDSTITATAGTLDKATAESNFTISKTGEYYLTLCWVPEDLKAGAASEADLAFVTACRITDAAGNQIYSAYGLASDIKIPVALTEGTYRIDYSYLTDEAGLSAFRNTYHGALDGIAGNASSYDLTKLAQDGIWKMNFQLNLTRKAAFGTTEMCATFCILFGMVILLMLIVAFYRSHGNTGSRYDERQENEQGRAFRYAFFATMIAAADTLMLDCMAFIPEGLTTIFYASSIFIGLVVYVIYSLWHDCYIALNEKRGFAILFLLIVGAINLLIGLNAIRIDGLLDESNRMNPSALNLLCGVGALLLSIITLVRTISERITEKDDGGDEE